MQRPLRASLILVISLALTSLATANREAPLRVVVTIQPLALLLQELGDESLDIHVLVPPGASPHAFEPRPSDLIRVARAELFVGVGGGLDDWAARLAGSAGSALAIHDLFSLLAREGRGDAPREHDPHPASDPDHDHRHDAASDPHVWLDPLQVRDEVAPALATLLIEHDPANESHYRERLARFQTGLTALDQEIRALLTTRSRDYLAFHNAWWSFSARYALNEIAVVEEAAGEQPTPREFVSLVRDARASGVGAVLIEPQFDPRLAETLGDTFDGITVLVDPLGDPADTNRSTYEGLLRFNAQAFRKALELNRRDPGPSQREGEGEGEGEGQGTP